MHLRVGVNCEFGYQTRCGITGVGGQNIAIHRHGQAHVVTPGLDNAAVTAPISHITVSKNAKLWLNPNAMRFSDTLMITLMKGAELKFSYTQAPEGTAVVGSAPSLLKLNVGENTVVSSTIYSPNPAHVWSPFSVEVTTRRNAVITGIFTRGKLSVENSEDSLVIVTACKLNIRATHKHPATSKCRAYLRNYIDGVHRIIHQKLRCTTCDLLNCLTCPCQTDVPSAEVTERISTNSQACREWCVANLQSSASFESQWLYYVTARDTKRVDRRAVELANRVASEARARQSVIQWDDGGGGGGNAVAQQNNGSVGARPAKKARFTVTSKNTSGIAGNECTLCCERAVNVICMPCGDAYCCRDCALAQQTSSLSSAALCCICRAEIEFFAPIVAHGEQPATTTTTTTSTTTS